MEASVGPIAVGSIEQVVLAAVVLAIGRCAFSAAPTLTPI